MDFVPNTRTQQEQMLKQIGLSSFDDLFRDVPESIFLKKNLAVGEPLDESALKKHVSSLSQKNATTTTYNYFLGAGCYNHFIPAAVSHLALRSEFLTAYTPYQPEISQGMLQSIYEWQSMISELTGMDLCNASMYDGANALAESIIIAKNSSKKTKFLISSAVHPQYKQTANTYAEANSLLLEEISLDNGVTSFENLKEKLSDETGAVVVQYPNFFGCIEDLAKTAELVHEKGSILIVCVNEAASLGLLKSPGELGADIVAGDAQSFGNPMSFGGPHVGFIAVTKKFMRLIPGRLVGKTVDEKNRTGYILTLQAREQHIRREKAYSNICSNQALCALAATIHLALLGKSGLMELANLNLQKAHYVAEKLNEAGVELLFSAPFFNEFVVKTNNAGQIQQKLLEKKIIAGYSLEKDYPELKDSLLVCVTEQNSKQDIDEFIAALKEAVQ